MSAPTTTEYEAIICGAGPAGIASAYNLQKDLGLQKIHVFERHQHFGGTWTANRYPGVACDIPPRLYSFSFAQKTEWSAFFGPGSEMQEYFEAVATSIGLSDKTTFNTTVLSAHWSNEHSHWVVTVRNAVTGKESVHTARAFISCVGTLSTPKAIDVAGKFEGLIFHSAQWPQGVDLTGKRVVVLGGGCTATQIVAALGATTKSLLHVVRGKQWFIPRPKSPFNNAVGRWAERNIPGFVNFERTAIHFLCESMFLQAFTKGGAGARKRVEFISSRYIDECAPPEYRDMLLPKSSELLPSCKRRVIDSDYIGSLGRPGVELTDDRAVRFEGNTVVFASGRRVEADAVVCANGFELDAICRIDVRNGEGLSLAQYYKQEGLPRAYRSTFVAGFPNYAQPWAVNAATGHTSAIISIEGSANLISRAWTPVFSYGDKSKSALERSAGRAHFVRKDAEDLEQTYIHETMKSMVYTTGCHSWYHDSQGRVTTLCPSFQTTFSFRCKFPNYADFDYRGLSRSEALRSLSLLQRLVSFLRLGATPDVRPDRPRSVLETVLWPVLAPLAWLWAKLGLVLLQATSWLCDHALVWERPAPYTAYLKGEKK